MSDMNESFATATSVTLPLAITDSVGGSDTTDFFTFTADETGQLTIRLSGLTDDLDLLVFNADNGEIARSENFNTNNEAVAIDVVEGQTYSIQVRPFEDAQSDYSLTSTIIPNFEPNNTLAQAQSITLGETVSSFIGGDDASDFYTFTASSTGPISFGLFAYDIDTTPDLDLRILDAAGNTIVQSIIGGNATEVVTFNAIQGETYFVQVEHFQFNGTSPYTIRGIAGELQTGREEETFTEDDVELLPTSTALSSGTRWEPGQTVGYDVSQIVNPATASFISGLLADLSSIISLDFEADPLGVYQFAERETLGSGVLGVAFLVASPFNDVFLRFNTSNDTIIHEFGHSLGLEHPLEDGQGGDENIHKLPFTLMNAFAGTVLTNENQGYASLGATGFLVLDLEYLVDVYGEDETNLGNNLYQFSTSDPVFEGLHDGAGRDTLRIEDPDNRGVNINVAPRGELDLGHLVGGVRDATVILTQTTDIEVIETAGGDDTITGSAVDNSITANGGDDTVYGAGGDDTLFGGAGDDTLNGGTGDDTLTGGAGADLLIGGAGEDTFILEASEGVSSASLADRITDFDSDTDTISLAGITASEITVVDGSEGESGNALIQRLDTGTILLVVENATAQAIAETIGAELDVSGEDIAGTGDDDDLLGSDLDDTVSGGGGDDTLDGDLGDDFLRGGTGNDTVRGGDGDDTVIGDTGDDLLQGGAGVDTLIGSRGADTLEGDGGNDSLSGGSEDDVLLGGGGNDVLEGGTGADTLNGGGGANTVTYVRDRDDLFITLGDDSAPGSSVAMGGSAEGDTFIGIRSINAGTGNDTLTGNAINNNLFGAGGDDVISGGDGNDVVRGGNGNDTLSGGSGNDSLVGNRGIDVADYSDAESGVDANLLTNSATSETEGTDAFLGIRDLIGSDFDDTLTGSRVKNILEGGDGDDVISGDGGSDTLIGGAGNDTLTGGRGGDIFVFGDDGSEDVITDYTAGDSLDLSGVAANFQSVDDVVNAITEFIDPTTGIAALVIDLGDGATVQLNGFSLESVDDIAVIL